MRLSSVLVAAVVFLSSFLLAQILLAQVVLAQHSSTSSSSGGASGGGSHAASSSGGASSSHGSSSHGSSSHGSSAHSSSAGSHSAAVHSSAGGSASASHNSGSGKNSGIGTSSPGTAGSAVVSRSKVASAETADGTSRADMVKTIREPDVQPAPEKNQPSASKTAQPEKRSFVSFLRHPFRKGEAKAVDSDLRRPICKEGPCKKPEPPVTVVSDLRPPTCTGKDCHCPSGGTPGKNGGCAAIPTNTTCTPGQHWNGTACMASPNQCPPNDYWNGAACVARLNDCASINARAAMLANDVRSAKSQMQNACLNSSSGQECGELKLTYDGAIDRYRMLQTEAPVNCRNMLAEPLSF
jgi:hypothetical protein